MFSSHLLIYHPLINANGLDYEQLLGLARTYASTQRAENSIGIQDKPEIAIVHSQC